MFLLLHLRQQDKASKLDMITLSNHAVWSYMNTHDLECP